MLRVETHDLEQLLHTPLSITLAADLVHVERLGDDLTDPLPGVERRVGILEDHHHVAAHRSHLGPAEMRDVVAVEDDLSARRLEQPGDATGHRRLAATRLADDTEGLAGVEREADAVDRLDLRDLLLEHEPASDGEVLLEILDDEQFAHAALPSAPVSVAFLAAQIRSRSASSRWQR